MKSVPAAALLVFAREPRPGRVKTRLARHLGEERACRVYEQLLRRTLEAAAAVKAHRYLYLPPGDRYPQEGFTAARQAGGDLGARMAAAFAECFARGHRRVVLIGSDCPYLTVNILRRAFDLLADHQVVLGPARDGGYYLVGQRAPGGDLFSGIPWSTGRVFALTRERLEERGWSFALLERLEDIDELEAYRRWQAVGSGG